MSEIDAIDNFNYEKDSVDLLNEVIIKLLKEKTVIKRDRITKLLLLIQYYERVIKSFISNTKELYSCEQNIIELLYNIFKYNRFISTKGSEYQDLLLQNTNYLSFIDVIVDEFECFLKKSVNYQTLSPLLIIYFQSLCNVIVNNRENQIIVWNKVIVSLQFQVLIEMSKDNMKLYNCITMIVYNCILHNDECLIQLLSISNKSIISSLLINSVNEESDNNNNEFLFLIIKFILLKNKTAKMIFELMFTNNNIQNNNGSENEEGVEDIEFEDIIIRKEELIFLEIYRTLVEEGNNDFKPEEYENDVLIEKMFDILYTLCEYLYNNNPKENSLIEMKYTFYSTAIPLLCSIISFYLSHYKIEYNVEKYKINILLKHFSSFFEVSKKEIHHNIHDFYSSIIELIGILCYNHRDIQDCVRESGLIISILSSCNVDMKNPLCREWSLIAIRNLCEDNKENQEYISKIKYEKLKKEEALKALHVK